MAGCGLTWQLLVGGLLESGPNLLRVEAAETSNLDHGNEALLCPGAQSSRADIESRGHLGNRDELFKLIGGCGFFGHGVVGCVRVKPTAI